jgi:hypothetical protein
VIDDDLYNPVDQRNLVRITCPYCNSAVGALVTFYALSFCEVQKYVGTCGHTWRRLESSEPCPQCCAPDKTYLGVDGFLHCQACNAEWPQAPG